MPILVGDGAGAAVMIPIPMTSESESAAPPHSHEPDFDPDSLLSDEDPFFLLVSSNSSLIGLPVVPSGHSHEPSNGETN